MGTRILLVDDEPAARDTLHRLVVALGHDGVMASDGADALAKMQNESFDLCLADAQMPEGGAVLEAARARRPPVPVVALTGEATVKHAVAALRAGAVDFLSKPFHSEILAQTVRRALGNTSRSNDNAHPTEGATLVGEHPAIRLMLERIDQVADSDANVLIRGEAGTSKQLIARLVHGSSARRSGPFVVVELAHLPEAQADAELFGEPGDGRQGRLFEAQQGTLFLDEVSALPKAVQAKLLRVLQDHALVVPGSAEPVPVDVRIIASASRNLDQAVRDGTLSDDLYYRLDVIPIDVPALRERKDDIPVLADHFRREINARAGLDVPGFSAEVMKRLSSYDWPGNIRQLETTIEKLVQLAADRAVTLNDLPTNLRADVVDLGVGIVDLPPYGVDLRLLLTRLEERLIGQALERTGGNKNRAAELLGMNRTTLVEKLRRRSVA
jgi:two-component system, NtrC family, response regulator AtoC